jgi:hypothetical protein
MLRGVVESMHVESSVLALPGYGRSVGVNFPHILA